MEEKEERTRIGFPTLGGAAFSSSFGVLLRSILFPFGWRAAHSALALVDGATFSRRRFGWYCKVLLSPCGLCCFPFLLILSVCPCFIDMKCVYLAGYTCTTRINA